MTSLRVLFSFFSEHLNSRNFSFRNSTHALEMAQVLVFAHALAAAVVQSLVEAVFVVVDTQMVVAEEQVVWVERKKFEAAQLAVEQAVGQAVEQVVE